jgi:Flp pilus assembly protein TadD
LEDCAGLSCWEQPSHCTGRDDLARQAVELMQAGRFHEAEILWRQLQVGSPNDPAIHSNLGVTLAQQGRLKPLRQSIASP